MRRLIMLALLLFAAQVEAQQFTLTTPVARTSVAKIKVDVFHFERGSLSARIGLVYQDSSNVDIPSPALPTTFTVPSAAAAAGGPCTSATTLNGLAGAMNVARSGEPAGNAAAQQFRILGYLSDQGCFPAGTVAQ